MNSMNFEDVVEHLFNNVVNKFETFDSLIQSKGTESFFSIYIYITQYNQSMSIILKFPNTNPPIPKNITLPA